MGLQEQRLHTDDCDVRRLAVSEHAVECDNRIDWDGVLVLDVSAQRMGNTSEALHIVQRLCERP